MGFPHGRENNDFTKQQPFDFLAKPTKWKKKTQQDRREKNTKEWRGIEDSEEWRGMEKNENGKRRVEKQWEIERVRSKIQNETYVGKCKSLREHN